MHAQKRAPLFYLTSQQLAVAERVEKMDASYHWLKKLKGDEHFRRGIEQGKMFVDRTVAGYLHMDGQAYTGLWAGVDRQKIKAPFVRTVRSLSFMHLKSKQSACFFFFNGHE